MPKQSVSSIMTKNPITIAQHLSVDVALETMRSNNVRRLPVLTSTGRLTGIITLYDALAATRQGDDWMGGMIADVPTVKEAMTANVTTVAPDETIAHAARLMVQHKLGALPVVEEHELKGIVTESDLFRYLISVLEPEEADEAASAGV